MNKDAKKEGYISVLRINGKDAELRVSELSGEYKPAALYITKRKDVHMSLTASEMTPAELAEVTRNIDGGADLGGECGALVILFLIFGMFDGCASQGMSVQSLESSIRDIIDSQNASSAEILSRAGKLFAA